MTEPQIRAHDVRLVPAAAAGWGATLVGVLGGSVLAAVMAVISGVVVAVVLCCRARLGAAASGLIAMSVVSCCYAGAAAVHAAVFESSPVTAAVQDRAWISAAVSVVEDPRRSRSPGPPMVTIAVELRRIDLAGTPIELGGRLTVLAPSDGWAHLVPGQQVLVRGRLAEPTRRNLTLAVVRVNGPPLHVQPPGTVARAASSVRTSLSSAAADALPADRAGVLPGLVVGDVSTLPEDVETDFRAAGLTHLTAVSGANFAILLGAVLLLTRAAALGPGTTVLICAVVLVAFVVVARPSPSVLRAAVMGAVSLLALVTGRRRQAVPALCTAVLGLLVWLPQLAVDVGFALSVAATAGLVVVAPVWVDWLRRHGWGRGAAEIVAVASAAHAVTAPIVAGMSGTLSVVGIAANMAVAPVVAPITVVGVVGAALAPWASGPASLVLRLTDAPLAWLILVAGRAGSVPGASIGTPSGAGGVAVVVAATAAIVCSLRIRFMRWVIGGVGAAASILWIVWSV
ncbi:competence protein ComEC [Rhodococcus sp. 06-621-2]|nr:ComEC/Rec2 family competence protein [Rhodococcus sp. 06-621-2]OZC46043.1 competence protein ComEC [Rhodococcus sp. 06-621-2]